MLKLNRKYNLIILILLFNAVSIYTQQKTEGISTIGGKLECLFKQKEKVFLHLNRNVIVSGDTLYFKAYYFKGNIFGSDLNNDLYIQLFNDNGETIFTSRYKINEGICAGAMYIPDTLSTGLYRLTGYTRWMQNINMCGIFYNDIIVINQSKPINNTSSAWTDTTNKISPAGQGKLSISIDSINIEVSLNLTNKEQKKLILLLINQGKIIQNDFISNKNIIIYSKAKLPEGISDVVLLDEKLNLLGETALYKPEKEDNTILSFTDKSEYETKEKVKLSIYLKDKDGNPLKGNLSVSVAEVTPEAEKVNPQNIVNYLKIYSEINPGTFLNNNPIAKKRVSDITEFPASGTNWSKFVQATKGELDYSSEQQGHIISGKAFSKNTGMPLAKKNILLFTPDKYAVLKYSITDSMGKFAFRLDKFFDNRKLIISMYDQEAETDYYIKLDTIDISGLINFLPGIHDSWLLKKYLEKSQKFSLINKIFNKTTLNNHVSNTDSALYNFFGNPDYTIKPSDFQELPDFQEIVNNLLKGVRFRIKKNNYVLETCDYDSEYPHFKTCFLLLNNVPNHNYRYLAVLGSKSIERIDVILKQFVYGNIEFDGLVSVITKDKTLIPDSYSNIISNELETDNSSVFNNSFMTKDCPKCPDYRQILYWAPTCSINEKGETTLEFYTSLLRTKYVINIQGVTSNSEPVSTNINFEVK